MKFLIPFVVLALSLSCLAQQDERTPTTQDLHESHNDLHIVHEFSERLFYQNRNQISSYITTVTTQLLDSFMDSYGEIHTIMDNMNEEFDALPTNNPCLDNIRTRWELQIHRHGQKLSECMWGSFLELSAWNDYLNTLNFGTQATMNLVQNLGVGVMTNYEGFTSREDLSGPINTALRRLLSSASPYLNEYEEFRDSTVHMEDQIISQLTMCDRSLGRAFEIEASDDLTRARNCLVD